MDRNKFGERLSDFRKDKNITQEEFASRLGVTPQAVSKWERGQSFPDITLLEGICHILTISSEALLGIETQPVLVENHNILEQNRILKKLCAEPLELIFGSALIPIIMEGLKKDLIIKMRLKAADTKGYLIPLIHMRDEMNLSETEYCIRSYGRELYRGGDRSDRRRYILCDFKTSVLLL